MNVLFSCPLQEVVSRITEAKNRALLFEANEGSIIQMQAYARGMLARKHYRERLRYLRLQLPAIVMIQSFVKGWRQKRAYRDRVAYLKEQEHAIVTVRRGSDYVLV